jgi:hypothetical protein
MAEQTLNESQDSGTNESQPAQVSTPSTNPFYRMEAGQSIESETQAVHAAPGTNPFTGGRSVTEDDEEAELAYMSPGPEDRVSVASSGNGREDRRVQFGSIHDEPEPLNQETGPSIPPKNEPSELADQRVPTPPTARSDGLSYTSALYSISDVFSCRCTP